MSPVEQKAVLTIPEHLVRLFRSVFSMPDEELLKVNGWAKANVSSVLAGDFDAEEVSEQLEIPRVSVYSAAQTIASILFLSQPPGRASLEGLASALNEIGPDYSKKAKILLDGVAAESSEAEFIRQRGFVSQVVLPTLENITAVSDLRGVFQYLPSSGGGKAQRKGVASLLGFEPMAIVGFELSDASGNESTSVFQMNEKGLRGAIKALEQCLAQLEAIREHQNLFVRSAK